MNHSLGKFVFTDIPPGPAGSVKINVTFKMDKNAILKVFAKMIGNEETEEKEVKASENIALTEEQLVKMKADAERSLHLISFGQ